MTHSYNRTYQVTFGRKEIIIEPLRGMRAFRALEIAVLEEVESLSQRVEEKLKIGPEGLLTDPVDLTRLLKLALLDENREPVITDELLEESTSAERLGLLADLLELNNLSRFTIFLAPEMLVDLAMKFQRSKTLASLLPASSTDSSAPELDGAISNKN